MNVREIVKKFLEANGYANLRNPENGCTCDKDELMPCAFEKPGNCKPEGTA